MFMLTSSYSISTPTFVEKVSGAARRPQDIPLAPLPPAS
jgi:hypothetical protein